MKDSIVKSLSGLISSGKLDKYQIFSVSVAICLLSACTDEGVETVVNTIYKNKA